MAYVIPKIGGADQLFCAQDGAHETLLLHYGFFLLPSEFLIDRCGHWRSSFKRHARTIEN